MSGSFQEGNWNWIEKFLVFQENGNYSSATCELIYPVTVTLCLIHTTYIHVPSCSQAVTQCPYLRWKTHGTTCQTRWVASVWSHPHTVYSTVLLTGRLVGWCRGCGTVSLAITVHKNTKVYHIWGYFWCIKLKIASYTYRQAAAIYKCCVAEMYKHVLQNYM